LLNDQWLSSGFLAVELAHFGPRVEIDIAALERPGSQVNPSGNGGTVTTLPRTWTPPRPVCSVPALFPDSIEVRIYQGQGAWHLVGAIELISPGNKDRPEERQALAAKCASYLHEGVSVAVIDIVTKRRANLHNEVLRLAGVTDEEAFLPEDVHLYAAAYRPVLRQERPEFDIWRQQCTVGEPLPLMPLRLTGDFFVPVDFETTYTETCRRRRIT
jgi:hypothetical protein